MLLIGLTPSNSRDAFLENMNTVIHLGNPLTLCVSFTDSSKSFSLRILSTTFK